MFQQEHIPTSVSTFSMLRFLVMKAAACSMLASFSQLPQHADDKRSDGREQKDELNQLCHKIQVRVREIEHV
jgi:hypothetical protein